MVALPSALEPLAGLRDRLVSLVDELDGPLDAEARADLATELVRFAARYLDVKERAVDPVLEDHVGGDRHRSDADRESLREALGEVRRRTRHVKPINAHFDDPVGFDRALDDLVEAVRADLGHESEDLVPLVEKLDPEAKAELAQRVERAVSRASDHPKPPKNPIARSIVNLGEKLDHAVHDAATTSHPAVDRMRAREEAEQATRRRRGRADGRAV